MAEFELFVNGKSVQVKAEPDTPLLWVIREYMQMTGTKFGCGVGICGICIVHLDGAAVLSCMTPISAVGSRKITTIEGLSDNNDHPLQKAWIAFQVPQCGFCQPAQIMQAAALLAKVKHPTRDEIIADMKNILCRCGTYQRIIQAIEQVAKEPL